MAADPWDHNGECTFCDELGAHAADCSWLLALEAEVETLHQQQLEMLMNFNAYRDGVIRGSGELMAENKLLQAECEALRQRVAELEKWPRS
jgi:regulator of replication initiation timing